MGCDESKNVNYSALLCYFEIGNEEQKKYCLDLKDHFQHEQPIRFEIKSTPNVPFAIKFKLKGEKEPHNIENNFNNTEERMKESLQKMYDLLDGKQKGDQ